MIPCKPFWWSALIHQRTKQNKNENNLKQTNCTMKRRTFSTYNLCNLLSLPMLGEIIPPSCMYGKFLNSKRQIKYHIQLRKKWREWLETVAYIERTLCSASGWHEIPVHAQGDSSKSCQLLRTFLVSFQVLLISNNAWPNNLKRKKNHLKFKSLNKILKWVEKY